MNLVIRAARDDDAETLAMLSSSIQVLRHALKPTYFKPVDPRAAVDWFRRRVADAAIRIWIAETDDSAVGYASVTRSDRPETPFNHAARGLAIDQIGVRPDAQRQGVGRALVRHVVIEARAAGITEVTLRAWVENTGAQQAFLRVGFVPEVVQFRISC